MSGQDMVDEEQCAKRMKEIYGKIDDIHKGQTEMAVSMATNNAAMNTTLDAIQNGMKETKADRKWVAMACLTGLAIVVSFLAMIGVGAGCRTAPKRATVDNITAVRTTSDYAALKRDISSRVRRLGINYTLPVTSSRSYTIEDDGTMWMQHAGRRVAPNRWTKADWVLFRYDCRRGLWDRLEKLPPFGVR